MTNLQLIKKLTDLGYKFESLGIKDTTVMTNLVSIINEIKLEEFAKQSKSKGNRYGNMVKAIIKFAKETHKSMINFRPALAGAWYCDWFDNSKNMYVCDGYVGIVMSKDIDGIQMAKVDYNKPWSMDMKSIFKDFVLDVGEYENICLPDINDLKTAFKVSKAESKEPDYIVKLSNGTCVDVRYLINLMEMCGLYGGEEVQQKKNSITSPIFAFTIEDDLKVHVCLLPIRKVGNSKILKDYSKGE